MKARQMKVDQNAFDVDEFIGRLKRTLGSSRKRARADDEMDENDEEENGFGDWEKLGWMGVKHSRRVCLPDFLYVCHPPFLIRTTPFVTKMLTILFSRHFHFVLNQTWTPPS
jgi:hypothetical protein